MTTNACLKVTGTKAQLHSALTTLGLDKEMLVRDKAGKLRIVSGNHNVAIDNWERPILVLGQYDKDGDEIVAPVFSAQPILRIRIVSGAMSEKYKRKITDAGGLPVGIERVACPTTRIWYGD